MTLLQKMHASVSAERNLNANFIPLMLEAEEGMLYAELSYSDMFTFLKHEFRFSESAAYRRVGAMRLARDDSRIIEWTRNGDLSLSNAALVSSILTRADKQNIQLPREEMLAASLNCSTRNAEHKLAEIAAAHGLILNVSHDELREHVEELRLHYPEKYAGLTDREVMKSVLLEKIEAAEKRGSTGRGVDASDAHGGCAKVKREVRKRDGSCTHVNAETGRRCCSTRNLQFHHIHPFARGGKFTVENITLHCRAQNVLQAKKDGLYVKFPKRRFRN